MIENMNHAELISGQIINHQYVILGLIAKGGMSEIYLVRDLSDTKKPKVLKRLFPHLAKDNNFLEMFKNEARLATQFKHPNLIRNHALISHKEDFFILMEYLDGRDMLQIGQNCRAHKQNVPFDLSVYLIAFACSGLNYAHQLKDEKGKSLNLIHRDMSPENILVTFNGEIKVLDFGIAKSADNQIKTQKGLIKGKLGYVSPEAILGEELDARADIFALGATLYLFLSGRPPFSGEHPMEVFEKTLKKPPSPLQFQPQIPKNLERICMQCLEPKAKNRYPNAGELEKDLRAHLQMRTNPLQQVHIAHFMSLLYPLRQDKQRQKVQQLLNQEQKTIKINSKQNIKSQEDGNPHTATENRSDNDAYPSFSFNSEDLNAETEISDFSQSSKEEELYEQDEFLDELTLEAALNLWTDEQKSEITFVDVLKPAADKVNATYDSSSQLPPKISQESAYLKVDLHPSPKRFDQDRSGPTQNIRSPLHNNSNNNQTFQPNLLVTEDLSQLNSDKKTSLTSMFIKGFLFGLGLCLSFGLFIFILPFILRYSGFLELIKKIISE